MDAIESVRQQTYANWEIILVDDGSTDNSHEWYQELKLDSRIHIYLNVTNHGIAYTKKRCIEEAKGEILCYLDPDDELTPFALEKHVEVHCLYDNVSIIFSRRYLCRPDMSVVGESRVLRIPKNKSYLTLKDFREEHLVSFKKSKYLQTRGLNTQYKLAVDTDLNFLMEEVGEIYCLDDICYKYRKNIKTMATANYAKHMFWNMLVQYDTCKRRGIDVEDQVYDWYLKAVEFASAEKIYQKEVEIRQSAAYRLGNTILKPIKWLQKLFSKQ